MSQIVGGWLSDIWGGEHILFWSCLSWILLTLSTPLMIQTGKIISSATIYMLIRFFMGFFQGCFSGAMASLLGKHLETMHKSSTNGFINSGACIGLVKLFLLKRH